jgi:hypothetical protein
MKYFVPIFALLLVVAMVPANAGWKFEYNINYTGVGTTQGFVSATPGVGHSRAGAVLGEDSFAFCNTGRPTSAGNYNALIYLNCTGGVDNPIFSPGVWANPLDASDTINVTWNWGVALDSNAGALLLSNQDVEYSILAWDPNTGAALQWRNELTVAPGSSGTYYPSQIDVDATGDVFVANYAESWIADVTPAVGNIIWYPAISSDPNWATATGSPHNPAPLGLYSTILGATQHSNWTGYVWIMEGVAISDDGTVMAYTSRGGGTQGVHVALGSPAGGYVYATSNAATLLPWYTGATGDVAISNVRGLDIAPDGQHIFFVVDDVIPNDLIGVWNWVTGQYADPIFLSVDGAHKRPLDREIVDLPYDVDVYEDDIGSPFALNVLVSPYYNWERASKYTGNLTTEVNDWSLY